MIVIEIGGLGRKQDFIKLDIGRVQAYELIKAGEFRSVKIGRSIRISKKVFLNWFEGNEAS
ncbi:helix-turn-helix domain-containing protein [Cohnella algarum]|uniref:helix-turn-helix domain-containing protein n=1 Tax=Cohnella algarum TaxID=2044859 RepID=UPI001F07DE35|nr:helix-turn-helix domain-containing protein [Cohnella algarum]